MTSHEAIGYKQNASEKTRSAWNYNYIRGPQLQVFWEEHFLSFKTYAGTSPILRWHPSSEDISRKIPNLSTNGNGLDLPDAANLQMALDGELSELGVWFNPYSAWHGCNPQRHSALNNETNPSSTLMHSNASSSKVRLENNASLSISFLSLSLSLCLSDSWLSLSLSLGASFYSIRQRRALIAPAILEACLWREKPVPSGLNDAWQPRGIQPTRRQ